MIISQSFTRPADTTAYASGDVMNGSAVTVPISFTLSQLMINPCVTGASIVSSNQTGTFTGILHLFTTSFTTAADNAAFAPTDSDVSNYYLGAVSIGAAWNAFTANKVSTTLLTNKLPLSKNMNLDSAIVYGVLVATSAYTPISGEVLTINLFLA